MKIKILNKHNLSYANEIASLHVKNINGKLSNIGFEFLLKIYQSFLVNKNIRIWILVYDKKLIGFLCGCADNKKIYLKFLTENFFSLIFLFLKNILNLSFLRNIYGLIILFLFSDKSPSINSELLSITISKKFRNKSYGRKLIKKLDIYLRKKNKKEYIVKVESKNKKAINFYLSNKFKHMFKTNYPLFDIDYLKKKL